MLARGTVVQSRLGLGLPEVHHVVAPDEHFAQTPGQRAVDVLLVERHRVTVGRGVYLSVGQLEVHVGVNGDEFPAVLHAPLELDDHLLPGETRQEGLGVHDGHAVRRPRMTDD